jgi:hypothetical protein
MNRCSSGAEAAVAVDGGSPIALVDSTAHQRPPLLNFIVWGAESNETRRLGTKYQ